MSKTITILLICCLVFLSGPAAFVRADAQGAQKIFLPLTGISAFQGNATVKGCLVTDTGGINDKSFNAMTWKGLTDARAALGTEAYYRESAQQADYAKNIAAFASENCGLIVTVGFLLGDTTQTAAQAHPNQRFAIMDFAYDPALPNVRGTGFAVDQAAFLAGYMAAGMTKTGKLGVFGGLQIPTVTIFMDGFYYGAQYYNLQKGAQVQVLGWDPVTKKGLFTGNFNSTDDGKKMGNTLMDEGADVIMPVAGAVGLGTAEAVKARGNAWLVGVDSDWTVTVPDYKDIILTSVMKRLDVVTYQAMADILSGKFTGGTYIGTLANGGVALGTAASAVPAALLNEIAKIKTGMVAGTGPTLPNLQQSKKACLVTDVGGINDQSFNAMTWEGLTYGQSLLGVNAFYLESAQQTDYAKNINAFISEKCDLILTTGFLMMDDTKAAAEVTPSQKFAISDVTYDPPISNVRGISFAVDQPSFLAGYLAAGMTKTGTVGVYGGLQIPTVTVFMDGYYYGVQYYNQMHGASVQVLGWNPTAGQGLFTNTFSDLNAGKTMGTDLLNQGADIIFPIAGPVGLGTAEVVQAHGNAWIIGPDTDWTVTSPSYSSIVLTSVMKRLDWTAYHAVGDLAFGQFTGGTFVGTLKNQGTSLGTTSGSVPLALYQEMMQVKAGIIAGSIPVRP